MKRHVMNRLNIDQNTEILHTDSENLKWKQLKYEPCLTSNLEELWIFHHFGRSYPFDIFLTFHSNWYLEFSVYKDSSDGVKVKSSNNSPLLRHLQVNIFDLSRKNSLNKSHLLHAYYPQLISKDEWIPLFSDIWILGYHGYLNIMDTWIVGYHGYSFFWIPIWILLYYEYQIFTLSR